MRYRREAFNVRVIHTPGHSAGSLSFFMPEDGALICGDVLPEPGTLPIYESVADTLASLEKLKAHPRSERSALRHEPGSLAR